jgi:hypothetical protein
MRIEQPWLHYEFEARRDLWMAPELAPPAPDLLQRKINLPGLDRSLPKPPQANGLLRRLGRCSGWSGLAIKAGTVKAGTVEALAFESRSVACAGLDFPPNVELGRIGTHAQRKSRPLIVARHGRPKRLRNSCEDHLGSRRDRQVAALA